MKLSEYIPLYRKNLRLAFPVVLSQVGQVSVSLADTIMVGHFGTTELAAASFSTSVFYIGMVFGIGLSIGITPLVGNVFSQKKEDEVGNYLKNGFFIHTICAIILTGIMGLVSLYLDKMGQPVSVYQLATPYYLWLVFSLLPMLMFFSIKQFLEGIGNTKLAMYITLSANAINILLNYLLIFGKLGFPELGLTGAGIATFISRMLMPVFLIQVFLINPKYKSYLKLAIREKLSIVHIKEILSIGIPTGLQVIIEVLSFSIGAVMMGWLGESQLAAHQIALSMASFTYMIILGIGSATTIHVSHEFGIKNYQQMKQTIYSSIHLILFFMICMGIMIVLLRQYLPLLFTNDIEVIKIAANLLIIAAMFQVFDGTQVALMSSLRGIADVKRPMIMAFISYILIGVSISYWCAFPLELGAIGIWIGFLTGLVAAAIFFFLRLKKQLINLL